MVQTVFDEVCRLLGEVRGDKACYPVPAQPVAVQHSHCGTLAHPWGVCESPFRDSVLRSVVRYGGGTRIPHGAKYGGLFAPGDLEAVWTARRSEGEDSLCALGEHVES